MRIPFLGFLGFLGLLFAPNTVFAQQEDFHDVTPSISDPGYNLQSLQPAWEAKTPVHGKDQTAGAPGYRQLNFSWKKIHYIRLRAGVISFFRLDPTETIDSVVIGDRSAFEIILLPKYPNIVQVHPLLIGVDSNMTIFTEDGRIYSMFLASHPPSYPQATDIIIDVLLGKEVQEQRPAYRALGPHPDANSSNQSAPIQVVPQVPVVPQQGIISMDDIKNAETSEDLANLASSASSANNTPIQNLQSDLAKFGVGPEANFLDRPGSPEEASIWTNLETIEIDVANLKFDYYVKVSSRKAAREIAPERVFRDSRWTYIDFGEDYLSKTTPVPTRVIDRTESPVAHRFAKGRRIMAIEAIGNFVLRDGQNVVCIYQGKNPESVAALNREQQNNSEPRTLVIDPQIESSTEISTEAPEAPQNAPQNTQNTQREGVVVIQQEPKPEPPKPPQERNDITVGNLSPITLKRILNGIDYQSVVSNSQDSTAFRVEGVISVHSGEVCRRTAEANGQCYVSISK